MVLSIRAIEGGGYSATTSSGETVTVEADDIRRIANTKVGGAFDRIATALADFQKLEEGAGVFGGSGPAAELASLHAQVKGVFVSTSDGVKQDLDSFGVNLTRGADNWDAADATSTERSRALTEQIAAGAGGPLATRNSWDGAREEAGESLNLGDHLAEKSEQLAQEQAAADVDTTGSDTTGA